MATTKIKGNQSWINGINTGYGVDVQIYGLMNKPKKNEMTLVETGY